MDLKFIIYEKQEGIARIRLNRPDERNALNLPIRDELRNVISEIKRDDEVKAVILTGAGKSFCAGGDIRTMGGQEGVVAGRDRVLKICNIFYELAYLEKPVIAGVHGAATGAGLSLVLSCDIVIATKAARFAAPFTKIGLVPDTGTTYFLPRVVGLTKAREMILTGELIDAEEAYRIGLISRIVAADRLESELVTLASKLAAGAVKGIGIAKMNLLMGLDIDLRCINLLESFGNALLFRSDDHREGMDAFLNRREPHFQGR
jgi:2-(1,2-epoxy-1,2-dihydrophenyl)acetyl-CoA isomerase